MQSHEFSFKLRGLARVVVPTLIVLISFVIVLNLVDLLGWLPRIAIASDPDRTMLIHQSRASHSRNPAGIVLVGDSTCLMGVDASGLSKYLPDHLPALNLSLIISIGLNVYGDVVSDFAKANPGQIRAVILLVTPLKLASPGGMKGEAEKWKAMDAPPRTVLLEGFANSRDVIGIKILRQRIFGHLLDTPLHYGAAEFFGFSSEIDAYQTAHHGSLIDFGAFTAGRRKISAPEWRLPTELESESRAFRSKIPAGAKLVIGLTPDPAGSASLEESRQRGELLRQWNGFIGADAILTNLPATWPNAFFSKSAHLNPQGQKRFTAIVGQELAFLLRKEK